MLLGMGVWKTGENVHLRRSPVVLDHTPEAIQVVILIVMLISPPASQGPCTLSSHYTQAADMAMASAASGSLSDIFEGRRTEYNVAYAIDEALDAIDVDDSISYEKTVASEETRDNNPRACSHIVKTREPPGAYRAFVTYLMP